MPADLSSAIRSIRNRRKETMAALGLRLGVERPTVSRYESGKGIPKRSILVELLRLAVTPEEKAPIFAAMGLDESMRGDDSATDVRVGDIYLQAKSIEAKEPRRAWKRGSLIDFAEKATIIVKEVRDADPALVQILDSWVRHHADAEAVEEFRDIAAELGHRLDELANKRATANQKTGRTGKR